MQVRLKIKAKRCSLDYGTAPCTASGTVKCYNTRATCQDIPNIDLLDNDLIYTTAGANSDVEAVFSQTNGDAELRTVESPSIISANIMSGQMALEGVASANTAAVVLADEHTLIERDDFYAAERENCGGSVWGRRLARDRLLHGYSAVLEYREPPDQYTTRRELPDALDLGAHSGINLNLIFKTVLGDKTYYFVDHDENGQVVPSTGDRQTYTVWDNLLNPGGHTMATQDGVHTGSDDARSAVIDGYAVLLPTHAELVAVREELVASSLYSPDYPNYAVADYVDGRHIYTSGSQLAVVQSTGHGTLLLAIVQIIDLAPVVTVVGAPPPWTATYWIVDAIKHPVNGEVTVSLIDRSDRMLKSVFPEQTPNTLQANLEESGDPVTASAVDEGTYWRLSSEIMRFWHNGVTALWSRAWFGTESAEHDNGDTLLGVAVQHEDPQPWAEAYRWLIEANFPSLFDAADFAIERQHVAALKVVLKIVRPEEVTEILADLCMAGQCSIYFDIFTDKLRFRTNTAFTAATHLISDSQILRRPTPRVSTMPAAQKTRVSYRYRLKNLTDDKSYQKQAIALNRIEIDALGYEIGDAIESKYAWDGDTAAARRVQRYGVMPRHVGFAVSMQDYPQICLGDVLDFQYQDAFQGVDGCVRDLRLIVTQYSAELVLDELKVQGINVNQSSVEVLSGVAGTTVIIPPTVDPGTTPPGTDPPVDPGVIINVYIQNDEEAVNLFNRSGQPSGAATINVHIAEGVVVGGTRYAGEYPGGLPTPAMRIAGFPSGTVVNIAMGADSYLVGASGAGRGFAQSNNAPGTEPGYTAAHGGDALVADASSGNIAVNISGPASSHLLGGGGGGGPAYIGLAGLDPRDPRNPPGELGFGWDEVARQINTIGGSGLGSTGFIQSDNDYDETGGGGSGRFGAGGGGGFLYHSGGVAGADANGPVGGAGGGFIFLSPVPVYAAGRPGGNGGEAVKTTGNVQLTIANTINQES